MYNFKDYAGPVGKISGNRIEIQNSLLTYSLPGVRLHIFWNSFLGCLGTGSRLNGGNPRTALPL
ncbi:MAG: hypothetical protein PUP92_32050, partial [Rhizonema sp. PD38]|nr:hypothetical protein [Rhizonema sp. PD38]